MARLFKDIAMDMDSFFKANYIAEDGFRIKTKTKGFNGEARIKDGNAALKGKLRFKTEGRGHTVDHTWTFKSSGTVALKHKGDISKFVRDTEVESKHEWDTKNNGREMETSVTHKLCKDTTLQLDVHHVKGGSLSATAHAARRICSGFSFSTEFKYCNEQKKIAAANFGALFTPTDYMTTFISSSLDGPIGAGNMPWNAGALSWRQRYIANSSTILGFDYTYNVTDKTSRTA